MGSAFRIFHRILLEDVAQSQDRDHHVQRFFPSARYPDLTGRADLPSSTLSSRRNHLVENSELPNTKHKAFQRLLGSSNPYTRGGQFWIICLARLYDGLHVVYRAYIEQTSKASFSWRSHSTSSKVKLSPMSSVTRVMHPITSPARYSSSVGSATGSYELSAAELRSRRNLTVGYFDANTLRREGKESFSSRLE